MGSEDFARSLEEAPPEVDVRYLLDVAFWGKAHYTGCAGDGARCTCRLGMLRRKYSHPVAAGSTRGDTDNERGGSDG